MQHVGYLARYTTEPEQRVDPQTSRDLALDHVFGAIDRTITPIGAQYLYRLLTTRQSETRHQRLSEAIDADPDLRQRIVRELAPLDHADGWTTVPLLWNTPSLPRIPLWGVRSLQAALVLCLPLSLLWSPLLLGAAVVSAVNVLLHFAIQRAMLEHYAPLRYLAQVVFVAERLKRSRAEGLEEVRRELHSQRIAAGALTAGAFHLRLDGAVGLVEFARAFALLEVAAVYRLFGLVERDRVALQTVVQLLAEVDAAFSTAALRQRDDVCVPVEAPEAGVLQARDLRHPLLPVAVGNDFDLHKRGALIVGHNMSGKSTFLRTVAVNVILAQTVHAVFARSFRATRLAVMSCVTINDDLSRGTSYYLEEARVMGQMLHAAATHPPGRVLFVVDEPFRGTNPVERVAAGVSVLGHLADTQLVVAATHDLELLAHLRGLDSYHFSGTVANGEPEFDYRLRRGLQESRGYMAIELLAQLGYPHPVVRRAFELLRRGSASNGHRP